MTLIYRKGDLIRLTVPTVSGWQGIGVVIETVHQDDDFDTVVAFRKQGEPDDATPSIALLNEVEPVSRFEPVPVSERLPGPGDCDAEGMCWWGRTESDDWSADWTLATPESVAEFCEFSPRVAWLPFHALPLPSGEVK